jgi:protein O-mannosyl-transferase
MSSLSSAPRQRVQPEGWWLLVIVVLAYLPAWQAGFIWDDDRYVTQNRLLDTLAGLWRIWFSQETPSQYVPLTYTSFWVEHQIWGLWAAGYHGVNVLLHAANAWLLWRLLQRLAVPGAWLAAALFALHPVQVESVAWISERKNLLSLFFMLLSAQAWVDFIEVSPPPGRKFYFRALVFQALALAGKATACVLPAALVCLLWLKGKKLDRRRLMQLIPFVLLGMATGLIAMWWERHHQGTEGPMFSLSPVERTLVASRALWFYPGKLCWPANLTFIYPQWQINAADLHAYVWVLAGVTALAVLLARRPRWDGVGVAAVFFVAMLSPLSGFIMLYTFRYTFVADHYQYVASIGPLTLAAAGLAGMCHRFKTSKPVLELAGGGTLLCVLGGLTWAQCGIYHDRGTLWRDTLQKNPGCWMAENNLANFLVQQGQTDEALVHYQKALALKSDYADAHYNYGVVLLRLGQAEAGVAHLEAALQADPDHVRAHNNLGIVLIGEGRLDEAIGHFEKALKLQPKLTSARVNLALALSQQGRVDQAISQVQQVLKSNPRDAEAQRLMALLSDHKTLEAQRPGSLSPP